MLDIEIKDSGKNVPDAYHGTSQQIAEEIQAGGKFLPSTGEKQFLGDGVYFFESSERHARDWARNIRKFEEIGIICAAINLGRCLELNNKAHRDFIRFTAMKLEKMSGRKMITDAFVINFGMSQFKVVINYSDSKPITKIGKVIDSLACGNSLETLSKWAIFSPISFARLCIGNTKIPTSTIP